MNIHSQLIRIITTASHLEQSGHIPESDRKRATAIRLICETVKGSAFHLRGYEVKTSAPAQPVGD